MFGRLLGLTLTVLASTHAVSGWHEPLVGEELLPGPYSWAVAFEHPARGMRETPCTTAVPAGSGGVAFRLCEDGSAVGLAFSARHADLSRYDEIRLWVRSDRPLTVRPFTQSSGWLFQNGGERDTTLPAGSTACLTIRPESMADPSMVESVGLQVRAKRGQGRALLEILAVTTVRRPARMSPASLRILALEAPASATRYAVFTATFTLSRTYDNPYDASEIDVQAEFTLPSGRRTTVPAFWFQDYTVAPGSEKYEQYLPSGTPHWRVRFLGTETGRHQLYLRARDRAGNVEEAGPVSFDVLPSRERGPVGRHVSNPLHLQYANRAPYIPLGHNLCFEDGNPDLNGTAYYSRLLTSFAANGENWSRLWMTDFARTALEWSRNHFSGFYAGAGTYSQRAAWRVDQFMEIAARNGVYVQLVFNDHGQFSSYVNARWNSGNPYGSAEGGPVPQGSPELFFSDAAARALFQRRLRYVIARWSAYPNLLAWELWNEVQFAGSATRNFQNDSETRSAIVAWHREMSDYLKAYDPWGHLVTTSSDDPGYTGFSAIWNHPNIDMVQSHHYVQPPSERDARIRGYVAAAQRAYAKPVIVAEMGVKASSKPECDFDPERFLADSDVPVSERTPANRDHMRAGTTLRNGLWAGALTQSSAMNWWWGCYICADERRNRRPPDFPLNDRLFPALAALWGGEDPAASTLENSTIELQGTVSAYGVQAKSRAFLWLRDTREAYGSGFGPAVAEGRSTRDAALTITGLDAGTYLASLQETTGNGELLSEVEATAANGRLSVSLPSFLGDIALKISAGTDRGWGLVPRASRVWTAEGLQAPLTAGYATLKPVAGPITQSAGAIISLSNGENATSDLTVPAVLPTREFWTVGEVEAPSNVGFAVVNPNDSGASLLLHIFDAAGRQIDSRPLTVPPRGHIARFLNELLPGLAGPFRGAVRLSSDVPAAILTLRGTTNRRGEYVLTTLPARDDSTPVITDAVVLPQVADGGGYQTEWMFLNPYDTPLSGRVQIRHKDGSPWPLQTDAGVASDVDLRIDPHGLVRWLSSGSTSEVQAGYCILRPDTGLPVPTAAAVVRFSQGGLQSESGVPFARPVREGGTYWESAPDVFTGIALANITERPQRVRLELFVRSGGEKKLEAALDLQAAEQQARLLTELFPDLPESGRGYFRFSSDGEIAFLALRLRRTARGDLLTSSLLLGELPDDRQSILPQVVAGGGYSTRFVVINPGDVTAEGRIAFLDSGGNPWRLIMRGP